MRVLLARCCAAAAGQVPDMQDGVVALSDERAQVARHQHFVHSLRLLRQTQQQQKAA